MAARASYIAGFDGTATTLAGRLWGLPLYGTMAHSFIQAWDDEARAFEDFARSQPENVVLLLDTYDTEAAARKVVALAPRLEAAGIRIKGVRLDSGDMAELARRVRRILDDGGLTETAIFASGGLDEDELAAFTQVGRAHRRLWRGDQPDHLVGRAGARLRLQAGGVRRAGAAQTLGGQGDLAGPQAGLAELWRGRTHGRRRPVGRGRPASGRAAAAARHEGGAPDRAFARALGDPRALRARARAPARAPAPAGGRLRLSGPCRRCARCAWPKR